jgi:hypothetical protein
MKVHEIINEAHHSILASFPAGPWKVEIDSHAMVSQVDRNIPLHIFTAIITYMCSLPDVLPTIPVGRGAYFQDTNTRISIYVTRTADKTIRVETVLSPAMMPKSPLFRRPVPAWQPKGRQPDDLAPMQADIKARGRDAVSQDLEQLKPLMPVNREQRRQFAKQMRRVK